METLGEGLEQVIDKEFDDKVAVGITLLIVIDDVDGADTQPFTVLVTTTVKIPAPDAIGFEDDELVNVPEVGTLQL
mgnify:CR=1 FL=1